MKLGLALDQAGRQLALRDSELRILLGLRLTELDEDVLAKLHETVHDLLTIVGRVKPKLVAHSVVTVNQL